MGTKFRLFGTVALVVAFAAHVAAQATYTKGYGYASAVYYASGPGIYANYGYQQAMGGYNYGGYFEQLGAYFTGDGGGNMPQQYSSTTAFTSTSPSNYSSFAYASIGYHNNSVLGVGNYSSVPVTLTIDVYTYGYASAYSSSWQSLADAGGYGFFWDTDGLIKQLSNVYAYSNGLRDGGDGSRTQNYDPYNGNVTGSSFYGNLFPYTTSVFTSDFQVYSITLQPGQGDIFYNIGGAYGDSYTRNTPGPAAVAPFALGLVGAMRRRRKRLSNVDTPSICHPEAQRGTRLDHVEAEPKKRRTSRPGPSLRFGMTDLKDPPQIENQN